MRRTAPARNSTRHRATIRMSLFPFLAVLICTMGALILLLVVMSQQARLQAAAAAEAEAAKQDEQSARRKVKQQEDLEDARWMAEQLEIAREKTAAKLSEARMVLGHYEDHARQLTDEFERLKSAWESLDGNDDPTGQQREQLEADLARTAAQIAEEQQRLAKAENETTRRRHSYALVVYEGAHQTHRQPIYIECRGDTVVLQPEGVTLRPEDFQGPMDVNNPLAAGLRAAREYLVSRRSVDDGESTEPYPLLLVRPDGIGAYFAARAALKSWETEFGYELIGEDWKIDFPAASPELAQVIARAMEEAKQRQRQMIALLGRHGGARRGAYQRGHGSGHSSRTLYRAAPGRGGIMRQDGLPMDFSLEPGGRDAFGGNRIAGNRSMRSNNTSGSPEDGSASTTPPPAQGSLAAEGLPASGASQVSSGSPASGGSQASAGSPGRQAAAAPRPGEWRPKPPSDQRDVEPREPRSEAQSLARQRGANWGLPDSAVDSAPLTRPIPIQCQRDQLVLAPQRGRHDGITIPLNAQTQEGIDEFVSAVWARMESWGMAGQNMYWRPVLSVSVAPDAEHRFADLQALLRDSGLTVRRK